MSLVSLEFVADPGLCPRSIPTSWYKKYTGGDYYTPGADIEEALLPQKVATYMRDMFLFPVRKHYRSYDRLFVNSYTHHYGVNYQLFC